MADLKRSAKKKMDYEGNSISEIEVELSDKTQASFLRQKVEAGLSEEERAALEFTVEERRITIRGPELLLIRTVTVLSTLGANE